MEHASYLQLLKREFSRRCERNNRYSLRAFARSLEIDAPLLSRILASKRLPSLDVSRKIMNKLDLSPKETQAYLASIIEAHKSQTLKRLGPNMSRIEAEIIEQKKAHEISPELYATMSDWYHVAILEMTYLSDFSDDPKWLASELSISPAEAHLAIDRLKSLGLIEYIDGRWQKKDEQLVTAQQSMTTSAHRKRQKQIHEKAIVSLYEDPIETRSHTGMTMAIDPAKIPEAKMMIREFNRKLCEFLEGGSRKQVYELSIALFSLSKPKTTVSQSREDEMQGSSSQLAKENLEDPDVNTWDQSGKQEERK